MKKSTTISVHLKAQNGYMIWCFFSTFLFISNCREEILKKVINFTTDLIYNLCELWTNLMLFKSTKWYFMSFSKLQAVFEKNMSNMSNARHLSHLYWEIKIIIEKLKFIEKFSDFEAEELFFNSCKSFWYSVQNSWTHITADWSAKNQIHNSRKKFHFYKSLYEESFLKNLKEITANH